MKKFLLAIALIIPLSGCAGFAETALNLPSGLLTTTINNPVGPRELAIVESSVATARSLALSYIQLGLCKKGQVPTFAVPCAERAVVLKIQSIDKKIRVALPVARKFVRNNDTINAGSALSAVREAVNDLRATLGN